MPADILANGEQAFTGNVEARSVDRTCFPVKRLSVIKERDGSDDVAMRQLEIR